MCVNHDSAGCRRKKYGMHDENREQTKPGQSIPTQAKNRLPGFPKRKEAQSWPLHSDTRFRMLTVLYSSHTYLTNHKVSI
jgi:hypothetical protein